MLSLLWTLNDTTSDPFVLLSGTGFNFLFYAGNLIILSPKFELQNFEICLVCVAGAWMEVVGARKIGHARGTHASLPLARPFFFAQ